MRFLRISKKDLLFILGLIVLYFALRLPNLIYQPIFADEAIYIRWAQVIRAEPTLRFLPLTDGKTPLFMWMMIPLFKVFEDPLFAGRLLSVISGAGTITAIFLLAKQFFNKRIAFFASFLMVVTPFIVFFDRLALVDSMLAAFSAWSLYIALLVVKYKRIDLAMLLGYLLGGAMLTKTPGLFNIIALPSTLLTFDWINKNRNKRLIQVFGLMALAVAISFVIYNILRLGPGFTSLNSRNQDYIFPVSKLIQTPFDPFIPHLRDLGDWSLHLLGLPLSLLLLFSVGLVIFKRNRVGLVILGWSLVPLLIEMNFYKTFTARYVLSSVYPLILLSGFGLDFILSKFTKNKWVGIGLIASLLIWPAYFNFNLHTNLEKTPLPQSERRGYLEDWTAGYGFKEIADFLNEKSKSEFIVVGTEGSFGTLPDGLQIYLDKNRQVVIIGGKATVSAQLRDAAKEHPTYFIANRSRFQVGQEGASFYGLELIKEYLKPVPLNSKFNQDSILLFKVLDKIPEQKK